MAEALTNTPKGIEITGGNVAGIDKVLTPEALEFLADLQRTYAPKIEELLKVREKRAEEIKAGKSLNFLNETAEIRKGDWKVGPIPKDLQDRRVEITGPVDRKMMINALNSGAKVFMADFEDSLTPGWEQVIQGQINCQDAVRRTISFTSPEGKEYKLNDSGLATLIVRPRGLHLMEKHLHIDGKPAFGAIVDFALYFFHNAKQLLENGSGPYFYIPKLESHQEARVWNDMFVAAQKAFNLPVGTIKATVLIETITAAFEMDEILYEMKDHIVAQNAGRWDYIFSYIKKHAHDADFICPDRGQVTMTQPFLRAYSLLLIKTCHKRGAFGMGGMAAYIPVKSDEEANEKAIANVTADKTREATDGHDGTWVAHPGLIPVAMKAFDKVLGDKPNQVDKQLDIEVNASDLLEVPKGDITEAGFRNNVSVSLQYMESWLRGVGCVPIFNLMEDAATAEIARTQLWQWLHHGASLSDGTQVTEAYFEQVIGEELEKIKQAIGDVNFSKGKFQDARKLLEEIVLNNDFEEFLTLGAYDKIS